LLRTAIPAGHILGRKLDSIPFSAYDGVVPGSVGFIEGYDLALSGSLLVLAKAPLQLSPDEVRALAVWATFAVVIGGFAAVTDRLQNVRIQASHAISLLLPGLLRHKRRRAMGKPCGTSMLRVRRAPLRIRQLSCLAAAVLAPSDCATSSTGR
jgi:hypothetical protein